MFWDQKTMFWDQKAMFCDRKAMFWDKKAMFWDKKSNVLRSNKCFENTKTKLTYQNSFLV